MQKSMDFTPLLPNAGPTGGDGEAWPAPTISLTIWSRWSAFLAMAERGVIRRGGSTWDGVLNATLELAAAMPRDIYLRRRLGWLPCETWTQSFYYTVPDLFICRPQNLSGSYHDDLMHV